MIDGIDNVISEAVDSAEATPALESATSEESTNDADATVDTDVTGGEADATTESETESGSEDEKQYQPVPYDRFAAVNREKKEAQEALARIFEDPSAYRAMYKEHRGIDPFEKTDEPAPVDEVDPVNELLNQILPPGTLDLTEEDFSSEGEWQTHQALVESVKNMAELIAGISKTQTAEQARQAAEAQAIAQRAQYAEVQSIFDGCVTQIEADIGAKLSNEQKGQLAQDAALYGDRLDPKEALERTAKILFYDRARQSGRDEASRIRDTKLELTAGRPQSVGGAASSSKGLSEDAAIEAACSKHGVY